MRALALLKTKIAQDVAVDELNYRIVRTGRRYDIYGTYKRPTIGFEPRAKVDAGNCRIIDLSWR